MSEQATTLFLMSTDAYVEGDAALAAALDDIGERVRYMVDGWLPQHADAPGDTG